jgi:hypothetical protein
MLKIKQLQGQGLPPWLQVAMCILFCSRNATKLWGCWGPQWSPQLGQVEVPSPVCGRWPYFGTLGLVVLSWGQFCNPGNIWQCLGTLDCYWHLVGRGQGCDTTLYNAGNSYPEQWIVPQPKVPRVPWLRSPGLERKLGSKSSSVLNSCVTLGDLYNSSVLVSMSIKWRW